MENTLIERISNIIAYKELSPRAFAQTIGFNYSTLNNYLTGRRSSVDNDLVIKTILTFDDISSDWLLTGKGTMLKDASSVTLLPSTKPAEKLIPLYRNEAAAGFGTDDFNIKDSDIEGYYKIKEFMNADFMLRVRGDSMFPLYKPGDTIAVREIKQINFIQWGKPHLIASRYQGLLIKRLYMGNDRNQVQAISENKELYPPFNLPMEEITGLALVIGTVRLDNF